MQAPPPILDQIDTLDVIFQAPARQPISFLIHFYHNHLSILDSSQQPKDDAPC